MIVHTGRRALLALLVRRMGRKRDDWELAEPPVRTDELGRLNAAHLWHLKIHQHQVATPWLTEQRLQRLPAVPRDHQRCPHPLQEFDGDLLVDFIVLSQKNPRPSQRQISRNRFSVFLNLADYGGEECHQRVDEHGRSHRLDQKSIHPMPLCLFPSIFAAKGRHQHDCRLSLEAVVLLKDSCRLKTIHAGHPPVQKDQVISGLAVRPAHGSHRLLPRAHHIDT